MASNVYKLTVANFGVDTVCGGPTFHRAAQNQSSPFWARSEPQAATPPSHPQESECLQLSAGNMSRGCKGQSCNVPCKT